MLKSTDDRLLEALALICSERRELWRGALMSSRVSQNEGYL